MRMSPLRWQQSTLPKNWGKGGASCCHKHALLAANARGHCAGTSVRRARMKGLRSKSMCIAESHCRQLHPSGLQPHMPGSPCTAAQIRSPATCIHA